MKAGFKILIASFCLIVYFFMVVYPFFLKNVLIGNDFSGKTFPSPVLYALFFYPVFWGYLYIVSANILEVRNIRTIVYPVCFLVIVLAFHAVMMIRGTVVLWYMLLTIPFGLIVSVYLLLSSIKRDLKDRLFHEQENEKGKAFQQRILKGFCFIVVPCFLTGLVLSTLSDKEKPVEKKEVPLIVTAGCPHFSKLIETANANVKIKKMDSLEEIVQAYQSEFQNKDVYGKIELRRSDQDNGEFYLYNDKIVWLIFTFQKKGECAHDSQNCFFSLKYGKEPCTQFVTTEN